MDIPVPHRRGRGGLQDFRPGQDYSTAFCGAVHFEDPLPRVGGLQGFPPEQSMSSSGEQINDIPAAGRGVCRFPRGIHPGQSTTEFSEQNADNPVPGGVQLSPHFRRLTMISGKMRTAACG